MWIIYKSKVKWSLSKSVICLSHKWLQTEEEQVDSNSVCNHVNHLQKQSKMVSKQECDLFIPQVIADRRGASGFQFSL